ncbi:MAG: hypothetical protein NTU72_03290, partial [Fimbriimonadales bacterium]|nr:hypothetical protein [Fimbriimonadales bacterium]
IADDEIVLKKTPKTHVESALLDRTVTNVGRIGKYFWLELDSQPWVFAHLGMAGWVRELGASTIRLREHGNAPFEDENGNTRFLKMGLETNQGGRVVMTDGRRLARIWMCNQPMDDLAISKLSPDWLTNPMDAATVYARIAKKSAPMKAILLDQSLFAGVGNWIADEALYQARIRPNRLGKEMSLSDTEVLIDNLVKIIQEAVELGADSEKFPKSWLFHYRWGGSKGDELIGGREIQRDQIGGRTTAWVPAVQD